MGTRDDGGRLKSGSDAPGGFEERGTDAGALPSYWPKRMTEAVLAESASPSWSNAAEPEEPLWERWFERALEEGVDEELASLGRRLMRQARRQRWDRERRAECGWLDQGDAMLELALLDSERARARWQALLDGEQ